MKKSSNHALTEPGHRAPLQSNTLAGRVADLFR